MWLRWLNWGAAWSVEKDCEVIIGKGLQCHVLYTARRSARRCRSRLAAAAACVAVLISSLLKERRPESRLLPKELLFPRQGINLEFFKVIAVSGERAGSASSGQAGGLRSQVEGTKLSKLFIRRCICWSSARHLPISQSPWNRVTTWQAELRHLRLPRLPRDCGTAVTFMPAPCIHCLSGAVPAKMPAAGLRPAAGSSGSRQGLLSALLCCSRCGICSRGFCLQTNSKESRGRRLRRLTQKPRRRLVMAWVALRFTFRSSRNQACKSCKCAQVRTLAEESDQP